MRRIKYLLIVLLLPVLAQAQQSLNGAWTFALDPQQAGEQFQWYAPGFPSAGFDKVQVPHSFSVDKRYFFYTGAAWYFKTFNTPVQQKGFRTFLRFEAVFYKTKIWLNGQQAGEHEGGYTPFEIDVTHLLKEKNNLAMSVNNAWDSTTIPGSKTSDDKGAVNSREVYAWMNYGGITRPVQLITRPDVFIQNVQVTAEPDLKKGHARIRIAAFIRNSSAQTVQRAVTVRINGGAPFKAAAAAVAAGTTVPVMLESVLPAAAVKLWNQDAPHLYEAMVIAGTDTLRKTFGIRKLEVKGTQLLLNGEPIRMGGCNRPLDYPGAGSLDTDDILEQDLALIKSGSMELSRLSHYPVSEKLLNWADKHGLLIIAEAGNWQMTPRQMVDPLMRKKYQQQLKEMIENDWNHPSVIAYSLGNEFQSQTPEGQAWVKDMMAYVKSIDKSRFVTFVSFNVWRDYVQKPEDEASQYVDFISANVYGNHLKNLQHIHKIYPDKPVYIAEFGIRLTENRKEADRIAYFKKAMEDFRQCDFLIGASVWTFNDYLSRYPGTDPDGYRAWGLVTPQRELRPTYQLWQEEFAPAILEVVSASTVKITARKDFPAYTLRNYQLRHNGKVYALKTLRPGESQEISLPATTGKLELVKPGGSVILIKDLIPPA